MEQKFVIIGGSGGIGSALARKLAGQGHGVHLIGRNAEKLAQIAEEISGSYAVADVEQPEQMQAAMMGAGEAISGLIYAVGTITLKHFTKLTAAEISHDFGVNVLGAITAVQSALPLLKSNVGISSILLFSTVAVGQGFPAHASIAAAKGAIEGLTRSLAAEFAPHIRVNCIAPSLIKTPLTAGITSNEQMAEAIAGMHALQRLGEPNDIAALGAFLLSPDASWISGQIIGVDGGRSSLRAKG